MFHRSDDVSRLANIPVTTLKTWARDGLLRPSVDPTPGKGRERIYIDADVAAARVARLLNALSRREAVRAVVEEVQAKSTSGPLRLHLNSEGRVTDEDGALATLVLSV